MKIAIVYKSVTGNTRLVAEAIKEVIPENELVYFGEPRENISADLYVVGSWTDKGMCAREITEFLKGIIEVYDNTKDEKLRNLARTCIPDEDSLYPLYYGLMVTKENMNEDGNIKLSREDSRFFDRISEFKGGTTIKLINKRYINQKCENRKDLKYKLKEIMEIINPDESCDMKDYGITFDVSKNSLYKSDAGEDIYVEDEDGKVYTYDKHPKRTMPLKKFTNVILIIDREKLKDKLKDTEKIAQIEDIATNRRKEAR